MTLSTVTTASATGTASQTANLANTGNTSVALNKISAAGAGFSQTNNCGSSLASGANCTIRVSFASAALGNFTGAISIGSDATTTVAIALTGTAAGQKALTLAPASLSFTSAAGVASAAQIVSLSNSGNIVVNLTGITISGSNAASFTATTTCGTTLVPGASCSASVTFLPASVGTVAATLQIGNDAGLTSTVALSGTISAAAPTAGLSASSIAFPSIAAGTSSTAQVVTLTNNGSAVLNISGVALSGPGANLFTRSTTCGGTLAAGASCTVSATFAPKVAGTYAATLTVTDNAGGGSQTIPMSAVATSFALTIDTSNPKDWKINNGAMTLDWNSTNAGIFGIQMNGTTDNLVDVTHVGSSGQPSGFYMDNTGLGSGTGVATYTDAGTYLDWSYTVPSSATNAFTWSEHFIVLPNDPGFHVYFTLNRTAADIAGGLGQIQYVFRDSLTQFTNTYTVDESLGNPGVQRVPLPLASESFSSDPGRAVSDATVDLHGFTDLPAGFKRSFYTKYDYSSYEYLHQAHGLYGSKYGAWTYIPSHETQPGGPTKQSLIFTGNLLMMEAWSGHLDNPLTENFAVGQAGAHLSGPFYIHFNTFGQAYNQTGNTLATADDMYADVLQAGASFKSFYDTESQLVGAGYVPSTARGSVSVQVTGVTGAAKTAWAVLSDNATNFQLSTRGMQYWVDLSSSGTATFAGVAPGTYRLSVYVLGQWGELRKDSIVVTANHSTTVPTVAFVPENFGTTVFTIGTPDRSSHEFLHGHDAAGNDDREFWGAFNYWADFAATGGAVIYNATGGPNGPATNDLSKWNYSHWGSSFDPGLFAGVYATGDDTTDGYKYVIPAYVAALSKASGTNGVSTPIPPWQIHFATPATQTGSTAQNYVVLSVAVACAEGSYVVTLNGSQNIWHFTNASDCAVRSGLSGYTQWFTMQWPASVLKGVGTDNVMTLSMSQVSGSEDDALRLELSDTSADPAVRGWNDYTYILGNVLTLPNDAVPNP